MSWSWVVDKFFVKSYLSFARGKRIEIILTSETRPVVDGLSDNVSIRHETGLAQVRGSAGFMRRLSPLYGCGNIDITFSTIPDHQSEHNIILIGGPARNEFTSRFLRFLSEAEETDIIVNDQDSDRFIAIGDKRFYYADLQSSGKEDYALVVFWKNPFVTTKVRAILCCGLTGYGTEAAVDWAINHGLTLSDDHIVNKFGLPRLLRPFWHIVYRKKIHELRNIAYVLRVAVVERKVSVSDIPETYLLSKNGL